MECCKVMDYHSRTYPGLRWEKWGGFGVVIARALRGIIDRRLLGVEEGVGRRYIRLLM